MFTEVSAERIPRERERGAFKISVRARAMCTCGGERREESSPPIVSNAAIISSETSAALRDLLIPDFHVALNVGKRAVDGTARHRRQDELVRRANLFSSPSVRAERG